MAGISITLAGNFTKLDELKDKAQKTATGIKSAFGSNIGKAMFGGIAVAGTAAFAAVTLAIKSAIDAGGELSDMMARTGADGSKLFVMQRAFENAGIAAANVPQALNKMQKALAGVNEEGDPTNKAFARLGLSIEGLMAMDPAEAFMKTSEAIAEIEDPAQRTATAMEIFGKSAGELLVVMTDPAAFTNAAEQVGALGQTLSENASELDAVSDAFGLTEVKAQQVGAVIAVELLPQLLQLSQWMSETDFSGIGGGIGILASKTVEWGTALAEVAQYLPMMMVFQKIADATIGGDLTPEEKATIAAEAAAANEAGKTVNPNSTQGKAQRAEAVATAAAASAEASSAAAREKAAKQSEKAAAATEKKAAAERKSAEQKERSRALAAEEYKLERDILAARLKGDAEHLAKLEREKAIREEMQRLQSAGYSAAEARAPAEKKADLAIATEKKEKERDAAKDARDKKREDLKGKIEGKKNDIESLRYESSVGSISSMQRIGGGGGAVSSGLDYQRQSTDLQRELNGLVRQLIDINRSSIDPG